MESVDLCLYFATGVKSVECFMNDGIVSFKRTTDILKFKYIIDSWLLANSKTSEKKYTDQLHKLYPFMYNQPFTYLARFHETQKNYVYNTKAQHKQQQKLLVPQTENKRSRKIKRPNKSEYMTFNQNEKNDGRLTLENWNDKEIYHHDEDYFSKNRQEEER